MTKSKSVFSPLSSILIANRGEIASRIIRTCKKMGIRSIAVYSDADRDAPFVNEANTAIYVGESSPVKSYLDIDKIIAAAKKSGSDAIHPGYGFLSENATFARRCKKEGIIFIGPNPEAIDAMGSKSNAKALMEKHGVPTVPGYKGKDQLDATLTAEANKIGYPVLLKATAGGGGKGMRIVNNENEIKNAIAAAKRESKSAFGDDELIVEKYIQSGRHIEFQIFGDKHGNAIHLLERECSIQRRYQKVMEESPSPILSAELRAEMGKAAVDAAKALNYDNAGTVEFIFDEFSNEFYFLEVNTRLQVEHPVTEEVTGLDLVKMQIESAQGKPLLISQEQVIGNGYAIELRLYAEDPSNNFLPVTGNILKFETPQVDGLRVESAVESGSEISVYYDPMIAKLIVWDINRENAMRKMAYVLRNLVCTGTTTNQDFLLKLVEHPDVIAGKYDTHFISKELDKLIKNVIDLKGINIPAISSTLFRWSHRNQNQQVLKSIPSGWRNSFYSYQFEEYSVGEEKIKIEYKFARNKFDIKVGEETYVVSLQDISEDKISFQLDGVLYKFSISKNGNNYFTHNEIFGNSKLTLLDRLPEKEQEKIKGGYTSPMPSQIVKVLVKTGDKVNAGDGLVILSSMKMESTITAEEDGVVKEVYVKDGQNVEADYLLIELNTDE